MNNEEFKLVLDYRLKAIRETLEVKAQEYVRNGDRFHNFKTGAAFSGQTQEQVLWGFLLKHLISIQDLIHDAACGSSRMSLRAGKGDPAIWREKIGDAINYLIILEAMTTQLDYIKYRAIEEK